MDFVYITSLFSSSLLDVRCMFNENYKKLSKFIHTWRIAVVIIGRAVCNQLHAFCRSPVTLFSIYFIIEFIWLNLPVPLVYLWNIPVFLKTFESEFIWLPTILKVKMILVLFSHQDSGNKEIYKTCTQSRHV
jgi:hypothetical protein